MLKMQNGLRNFFATDYLRQVSFLIEINAELRELVRYRRSIIEERARQHNRIQKVLEGANIKLGSVVSDILGVSS
jgi:transposase